MNRLGKEDFYKMGIVFSLFLIIIIIVIVFVYKKEMPEEIVEKENNKFVSVTDYNLFFFVNNNINNFINYTVANNTDAILSFLDNDYKQEKNLNNNSIYTIKLYKEDEIYQATKTKSFTLNENTVVYYTEGKVVNEGYDETTIVDNNVYFLLYVDFENMATSLAILDNSFDEDKFVNEANKEKKITLNAFNRVEQIDVIDYTTICSMYLSDFIWKVYNEIENAFPLTTNFSNLESFKTFVLENNITSEIKSCTQTNENDKRIYQMVDRNNYKYTFIEENILDYRVSVNK